MGNPHGVTLVPSMDGQGALFSSDRDSRIEYRTGIPAEGTLEWLARIDSGYYWSQSQLHKPADCALLFATDAYGGDVTWPGGTKFTLCESGELTLFMAIAKYNKPPGQQTDVKGTAFRFWRWHTIGISYGSLGQYIMLDGTLVGSSPQNSQRLGSSGNHQAAVDVPTIGNCVSGIWKRHEHDGGFDGVIDKFRVSTRQQDWLISKSSPGQQ
jgi:hypothetical protein